MMANSKNLQEEGTCKGILEHAQSAHAINYVWLAGKRH